MTVLSCDSRDSRETSAVDSMVTHEPVERRQAKETDLSVSSGVAQHHL